MKLRLTALLLAMCLCAALPGAVRAEDAYPAGTVVIPFENGVPAAASGEGWAYDESALTLTLDNGHSFAAEGECNVAVVCNGVIEGGRFRGRSRWADTAPPTAASFTGSSPPSGARPSTMPNSRCTSSATAQSGLTA